MEFYDECYPDYLMHYGVKGMKWGVRRYQNADGILTVAGKMRMNKLNRLDSKDKRDRFSRTVTERNMQKFSKRKDPVSKILTKSNEMNMSTLNKTIDRNDKQIKSLINDLRNHKVDVVVGYNSISNKMQYKQSDEQRMKSKDSSIKLLAETKEDYKKLYREETKWVKETINNTKSDSKLAEIRDNEYAKGNYYRGKAQGTGSMAMNNYVPPESMSERQWTQYMQLSEHHYKLGEGIDAHLRNRNK